MAGRGEEDEDARPAWASGAHVEQVGRDDREPRWTQEEIDEYLRRRKERGPRGPPPPAGRPLVEVKGKAEARSEEVRREAARRLESAAAWTKATAARVVQQGAAMTREATGWLQPAVPIDTGPVDWERELFLPEERDKIREWRAQGLRPPLDWDAEVHARVAEYAADVMCRGMRDALTACYERNYTHLTAGRCGNRMRWFKQCTRSAVLRAMPDWGTLAPAESLDPDFGDDFAPKHMRWPPTQPTEAYVFPSAAFRYELMDAIGDFRMDSLDVNAWPMPFLYAFREELGVPDWMFDWPTAFGPGVGPVDGQTKHRDLWPNLHAETENWSNEYADEYVRADMWVATDPRAKGEWRDGFANTCHSSDPYCRSSRQVLRYRLSPWRMIIEAREPSYSLRDLAKLTT